MVTLGNALATGQVLQKDTLNFASLGANSNKFYILELRQNGSSYTVFRHYGRMGASGQRKSESFSFLHDAQSSYNKIYREKITKGYKKVEMKGEIPSPNQQQAAPSYSPRPEKELADIQDKVLKLIGRLYTHATDYMTKSVETPLGAISANQVERGYRILKEIEKALDQNKVPTIFLSDEFYSVIPVMFGSRVDINKMLINSYDKLNERKNLLDVMESVALAQKTLEKTLEEKYASLKMDLKSLSSRTKEFKRIKEMVESTQSRNHSFNIHVTEVYEVKDMVGHDRFNPKKLKTTELFHGSRNENILSIMQSGLRMKPASAVHSGSMFGSGIYFANHSSKSANYCWGFNRSLVKEKHYLFLCEVATGNIKEFEDAQSYLSRAPRGYDSVMGKKGRYLHHDEIIVYDEKQVRIKHIIEFEKR